MQGSSIRAARAREFMIFRYCTKFVDGITQTR